MDSKCQKKLYNPNVLILYAYRYLGAQYEYFRCLASYDYADVDSRRSFCASAEDMCAAMYALYDACDMVHADCNTVMSTAKAICRHERRARYKMRVLLPADQTRRYFGYTGGAMPFLCI